MVPGILQAPNAHVRSPKDQVACRAEPRAQVNRSRQFDAMDRAYRPTAGPSTGPTNRK
jgi:hypothetical protein